MSTALHLIPPPPAPTVRNGVEQLFREFALLQSNDWVVAAYTPDSREYAAHIVAYLKSLEVLYSSVVMAPLVDDSFLSRLSHALPMPDAFTGNLVVITLERDTMSHFDKFAALFRTYGEGRTRILRVISASDEFFMRGLSMPPQALESLNATLLEFLADETDVVLTSSSGTELEVSLDQRFEWISNRGKLRPGAFTILPAGEIATHPASVRGKLVANGAINCNVISHLDMRLSDSPLTVDIHDSYATSFHCADTDLLDLVTTGFAMKNARWVGELGFGTNRALGPFIAHNSHLNERHPGIHIGFGQHNQSPEIVPYEADIHLDAVTEGGIIYAKKSGASIDLNRFSPNPTVVHPTLIRDEDITGDCCSAGCAVIAL